MPEHSTYVVKILHADAGLLSVNEPRCTCGWRGTETRVEEEADAAARAHGPLMVPEYKRKPDPWEVT